MLLRISLILAILAGLGAGALNFTMVKDKIVTLQNNLKEQTDLKEKAQADASKTHKDLDRTTAELKTTKQNLDAAVAEKDKAVAEAATQIKRADKLNDDLNKTRKELDVTQGELASYVNTGLKPPQILSLNKDLRDTQTALQGSQDENKLLGKKIQKLENELAIYRDKEAVVLLPAALRGKVLVTDPKWNFVVLDVGENQGILEYGELLVNRNGKLVAKIKVRSVQKDRCVANVLPGWQLGEVLEGDQVIPAHPAS